MRPRPQDRGALRTPHDPERYLVPGHGPDRGYDVSPARPMPVAPLPLSARARHRSNRRNGSFVPRGLSPAQERAVDKQ